MANVSVNGSLDPSIRHSKWRLLLLKFTPSPAVYRPERHYMRGPGPKYREKHPVGAVDLAAASPRSNFLPSSTMWP